MYYLITFINTDLAKIQLLCYRFNNPHLMVLCVVYVRVDPLRRNADMSFFFLYDNSCKNDTEPMHCKHWFISCIKPCYFV